MTRTRKTSSGSFYYRPESRQRQKQKKSNPFGFIVIAIIVVLVFVLIIKPFANTNSEASNDTNLLGLNDTKPTQTSTPTPTPTPTKDPLTLKQQIQSVIAEEDVKYGIYIKNLKTNQVISINPNDTLPPASIYKVPLAILVLRDIDAGKLKLDQTFTLKSKNKTYTTDSMYYLPTGKAYPIETYLNYLIVNSDNTAMTSLEDLLGGVEKINQRLKTELGVKNFFRIPHETEAAEVGKVFEGIYAQSFLEKETNDFLLNLLKHTASHLQDRIPAGVPASEGIEVAHKIGYISTGAGASFEDAGIVYSPKADYVIVTLNQDVREDEARIKIQEISRLTYKFFSE
jgi:beta-lactamase class A